ncbi:MAG: hydroxyacylglutathione hydrolase [Alphaproteobacteria bacterium]|nr:hydroxyacylglutathione hydrolase [Alphaproteobacteria bacterium]
MAKLEIVPVLALNDNYAYLLHDEETGVTGVIDASEADPVMAAIEERGWELSYILSTHHHWDHTGGNLSVKEKTGCKVVGAKLDAHRIPGIDVELSGGDEFKLGNSVAKITEIPGHTTGHIAFYFEEAEAVFCGDTLFSLGCGRIFEGTPAQLWNSIQKLRALPDETKMYCGHEYTYDCAGFAAYVEPENPYLREYVQKIVALRQAGEPTMPTTILTEKRCNPFMRADVSEFQKTMGMEGEDSAKVFANIGKR